MADIAVKLVLQKLTDAFIEEAAFLYQVPAKIEWIRDELRSMRCFLADAAAKGTLGDERVKNWVTRIRDVAYEAEDIIDEIRFKIEERRSSWVIVSILKSLITSHKIGARIDDIKKKIEGIAALRATYGIKDLGEGAHHDAVNESNAMVEFYRRGEESDVVGFEIDKQKLLDLLLDANCTRRSAVTVVGMAGLGKTTRAREVYRSPEISKYFGAKAFVSVSRTPQHVVLVKDIIKQVIKNMKVNHENEVTKEQLDSMSEEEAKEMLQKFLRKRRYLIVLDDIWETEDWYRLKDTFPDVSNGSRLLITTRSEIIAEHAEQIIPPHKLQKLSDDDSWDLFQKKAFPVGQRCPEHLEELGRRLSRRCDGLPLALVVLGGLFSRKPPTYVAWSEVANRLNWESTREAGVCLDIMALSYHHLPHQNLRLCFLYIGHFPEDHAINACRLTRLWVAEGLIRAIPNETLEETARDYLNELVRRSMVQEVERSMASGKIKSVRIHDLLRDVCIGEARKAGFMVSIGENDSSIFSEDMNVYRITVSRISVIESMLSLQTQKLHTLLCFEPLLGLQSFGSLTLLRVIDVEVLEIDNFKFLDEIGRLIHLRYLRCKFLDVAYVELPSNMGNLYNLQTLDLGDALVRFPTSLWTIPALRHVVFGYLIRIVFGYSIRKILKRIPALNHLHTLYYVPAGEWIKIDLPNAVNLRKLGVRDIRAGDVEPLANALEKLDNLVSLNLEADLKANCSCNPILEVLQSRNHLRSLKLYWRYIEEFPATSNVFAPSLTKLILGGLRLKHDPMLVLERLPNLVHLELVNDSSRRIRSSAGGFRQLQFLRISDLRDLEDWMVETRAMPKLVHLLIVICPKLKMIPYGLRDVTSLQKLELKFMREDFNRRVSEGGEDWEKVKHIPSIII